MKDDTVHRPVVREYLCPRGCGWRRKYTDSPAWMERVIEHPLYGNVSGGSLLALDINNHQCGWHLDALRRLRELQHAAA